MNWADGWKLKPETAADTKEAETIQGMRKRLHEFSHFDPVVRAVMNEAYHLGLSGEDTMTLLAYRALLEMERFRDIALDQAMLRRPAPIMVGTAVACGNGIVVR